MTHMRNLLEKKLRMARYAAKTRNTQRHNPKLRLNNYQKTPPAVRNWEKFILTEVEQW